MVNIIKEELPIEESLKRKLELICEFSKTTPTIINGNIREIDRNNLTYIEPNRIIIKDKTFLIFNYFSKIFIENLSNKMKLLDLEDYLKTSKYYSTLFLCNLFMKSLLNLYFLVIILFAF